MPTGNHRHPGHTIRTPPAVWAAAADRAHNDGLGDNAMTGLINTWAEAYAEHRLIVLPRTAEPATEAERDAATLDVADLAAAVGRHAAAVLLRAPGTRVSGAVRLAEEIRADSERLARAREHQAGPG